LTTVSIITPTFNRPDTLAELLEALSRQSYKDFEVIIVNDAGAPVQEVVALYPELNVTVIDLPRNSYHVVARNAALPHVRGQYVMPIDDDDLITADLRLSNRTRNPYPDGALPLRLRT